MPFVLPRVVAFDGDDTLWHNESLFSVTQERFRSLLDEHVELEAADLDARLLCVARRNLKTYGYGIKSFVLSMVETAIEVTDGRLPASDIALIVGFGRAMLEHPIELIEGAEDVLGKVRERGHDVWLITKGDLFDQESKIGRSGLEAAFDRIEIVSEKDEATYRRLLERAEVSAADFAMIGNSLRSDILPVLAIGGQAFHVPYHLTWEHERVDAASLAEPVVTLSRLSELLSR
jgi:putative hydrolase of the HAD superfamily